MNESTKKRKGESAKERKSEPKKEPGGILAEASDFDELSRTMEPEYPPESAPQLEEDLPYTVGTWRGFTQWKCKLCPWDTLEGEKKMLEHIASAHAPPPEPKSPILIADKSGRQIN